MQGDCWLEAAALVVYASLGRHGEAAGAAERLLHCDDPRVAEWLAVNDLSLLIYDLLGEPRGHGAVAGRLRAVLPGRLRARRWMSEVLEASSTALEDAGVDYVVFKTLNRVERVDVDVDIIVPLEGLPDALKALLARGFRPVDDISKTYATGLALPGNPIILDLHTSVTVLGMPYFDARLLLSRKARVEPHWGPRVYHATPEADAAVRVAHAVIKEAEVRVDDVSETLPLLAGGGWHRVRAILEAQRLAAAEAAYTRALHRLLAERLRSLPARLPEAWRLTGLLEALGGPRALPRIALALGNVRYRRNAEMIGRTLAYLAGTLLGG